MNFTTEKEFMFTHLIQQKLIKEKSKYENKVALLELLENNINKMPSLISVQKKQLLFTSSATCVWVHVDDREPSDPICSVNTDDHEELEDSGNTEVTAYPGNIFDCEKPTDPTYNEDTATLAYIEDAVYIEDPTDTTYTEDPIDPVYIEDPVSSAYIEDPTEPAYIKDPAYIEELADPEYLEDPVVFVYIQDLTELAYI